MFHFVLQLILMNLSNRNSWKNEAKTVWNNHKAPLLLNIFTQKLCSTFHPVPHKLPQASSHLKKIQTPKKNLSDCNSLESIKTTSLERFQLCLGIKMLCKVAKRQSPARKFSVTIKRRTIKRAMTSLIISSKYLRSDATRTNFLFSLHYRCSTDRVHRDVLELTQRIDCHRRGEGMLQRDQHIVKSQMSSIELINFV